MRTRTITVLLSATALLAGCSGEPSYDESVEECVKAVKARTEGDVTKPKPCESLKEDDYTLVVMNKAMGDLGWTDKDGRFDKEKFERDARDGKP
ncbi:hypothetical protein OG280_40930 (plasmid) [Streptomyces virginiae]|uniref:hypothetical protein n=1 Tax=Streptomyces virginiae TaxID=1961 RepID=UPI002DD97F5D|nr:hypothetical protein [Streptomyces virginiae]WSC82741.1 hypothetical protein OHA56_40790 [Streptomyces virginiae]